VFAKSKKENNIMPGNTIKINDSENLEWYIGDSFMDVLINWLDNHGVKTNDYDYQGVDNPEEIEHVKSSEKMKLLNQWLSELVFPGRLESLIQILKNYKNEIEEVKEICLYTNENKYKIYAIDRKNDDGYLGCSVTTRKMRAGEDWFRGNDLIDGPFLRETWMRIMCSIVNYELITLSEYKKPAQFTGGI
jgi:hypothetical protein